MDQKWYHNWRSIMFQYYPAYSPDINPCDFWIFGMLKGVLKDSEFNSSDQIEKAIAKVWDEPTFNEVWSIFHNWISRLAWVIENGGEYIME
jgi:hypothetical protein